MTDAVTLSYINLYAVLGALPKLCELVPEASALIKGKPVSVGFAVKGGPHATLCFQNGGCTLREGVDGCDILLPFSSPEKFNGLIDGTVTPVPRKGFTRIGFLLKDFTALTNLLTRYLKAGEDDLKDEEFFTRSTTLMLYVVAAAVCQVGNHDAIGRFSASYIVDGTIRLSVHDGPAAVITAKGHTLAIDPTTPQRCTACMEFSDIHLARDLFDGKVNAVACIGTGGIRMSGMISMIDNVNRILDRVALYLA